MARRPAAHPSHIHGAAPPATESGPDCPAVRRCRGAGSLSHRDCLSGRLSLVTQAPSRRYRMLATDCPIPRPGVAGRGMWRRRRGRAAGAASGPGRQCGSGRHWPGPRPWQGRALAGPGPGPRARAGAALKLPGSLSEERHREALAQWLPPAAPGPSHHWQDPPESPPGKPLG